jgi:hypothetical protein
VHERLAHDDGQPVPGAGSHGDLLHELPCALPVLALAEMGEYGVHRGSRRAQLPQGVRVVGHDRDERGLVDRDAAEQLRPARRKPQCDRPAEGTARHVRGRGSEPLDQGLEVVLVLSAGARARPRFALPVTTAVIGDHPERHTEVGLDRGLPRGVVAPRTVDEDERVALPDDLVVKVQVACTQQGHA